MLADDYMGHLIGEGLQAKGYFQLSYEQQMQEMLKLPVTRLFDTPMHKRLRDDLQNYFGNIGLNWSIENEYKCIKFILMECVAELTVLVASWG